MQHLTFSKRSLNGMTGSKFKIDLTLEKPMLCPHCLAFQDGITIGAHVMELGDAEYLSVIKFRCANCNKLYVVMYTFNMHTKSSKYELTYPAISLSYSNERINKVSPRFIEMYNQALQCESVGNLDLAAIGLRASLEILIKDYAINELKKSRDEVAGKKLFDSISEYLSKDPELISSADVVRILGNDFTHYDRKYPEHDYEVLKSYMSIFIQLVDTKLMLTHPPVSRKS